MGRNDHCCVAVIGEEKVVEAKTMTPAAPPRFLGLDGEERERADFA